MEVCLIESHEQFLDLKLLWSTVYERDNEAHYFLSWQWLSHLYEQRPESVSVLALRTSTESLAYAAFMPLRRQVRLSKSKGELYNAYCMGGNYWADYTGVLCLPEVENAAITAFSKYLCQLPWRRLFLESMCISDRRLKLLTSAFADDNYSIREEQLTDNQGTTDLDKSPGIALPDAYETYLTDCLTSNTRQKIRRFMRQIDNDSSLRIERSETESHEKHLEYFQRFWIERWADEKGSQVHRLAGVYSDFIRKALNSEDMFLLLLLDDDRPVSMIACYMDRIHKRLLFFVGARDLKFNRFPSGLVLHATAIEWAIVQGYRYYDLLRGDEAYKYSLGARDKKITNLVVTARAIESDAEFLDTRGIDRALELVTRFQTSGRQSVTARLYRQMLESWPDNAVVLCQYADWLESIGEADHCNSIRVDLELTRVEHASTG